MKILFLFLGLVLVASLLAGCSGEKDRQIYNLQIQNEKLTAKVISLKEEKKDLEDSVQTAKNEKSSLEGELRQRDWVIKRLATRLSSTTVVNEIVSVALTDRGQETLFALGGIFYIKGEESSAWTMAEEKKLAKIGERISFAKEVVVK